MCDFFSHKNHQFKLKILQFSNSNQHEQSHFYFPIESSLYSQADDLAMGNIYEPWLGTTLRFSFNEMDQDVSNLLCLVETGLLSPQQSVSSPPKSNLNNLTSVTTFQHLRQDECCIPKTQLFINECKLYSTCFVL